MLPVVELDGTLVSSFCCSWSDASKISSLSTSAAWAVECLMDCLPSLKACGTVSVAIQFLVLVSSTINTHWWESSLYSIALGDLLNGSNM